MSYTRKAVFGVGIIILLHLVAALFGYGFRFVLARNLTVEEYGLFYSVLAFFLLFSTIKDLGIGNALVITLPKLWLKKKWGSVKSCVLMTYGFKLVLGGVFALLFWFLAPWLADNLFKTNEAAYLLRIMAVVFFLGVNEEIFISVFLGLQKYSHFACIELFKKIFLFAFLLVFLKYGLQAPAFAYLTTAIVLPFVLYALLRRTFPRIEAGAFSGPELKTLVLLGLPFVINTATYSIVSYFDTLLLTSQRTLHEVGLYNVALPTAMAVLYFLYAFDSVIQPLASELYHAKKKNKLGLGLSLLHKYVFTGILLICMLLVVYAGPLIHLLYGQAFLPAVNTLRMLMIGILCYSITLMNLSVLSGIGQPKQVAKIQVYAAILNVVLNLILIPVWGMNGAALATVLSYFLALLLSFQQLGLYVALHVPWASWNKALVLGIVIGAAAYGTQRILAWNVWLETLTTALVSVALYVLLIFFTKTINWSEIKMLWKDLMQR